MHKKITNATGEYKFTRLHPGAYTLTVRCPETSSGQGFVTQTKKLTVAQNGTVHDDFTIVETIPSPILEVSRQ